MVTEQLVSVIIPAYRCAQYIGECLDSILNQTHRCLEAVVVDDGSDDGLCDVVLDVAGRDDRVRLIRSPHIGNAAARNLAFEHARGEFFALQDADDWSDATRIEKQVAKLNDTGADLCSCFLCHVRINGTRKVVRATQLNPPIYIRLQQRPGPAHASFLYRRSVYERAGGYETTLDGEEIGSSDTGWFFKLLTFDDPPFRWACVEEGLYFYREHLGQYTKTYGHSKGWDDLMKFNEHYRGKVLARLRRGHK